MIRNGIRPDFRLALTLSEQAGYRRVLPFPRSWKLIFFVLLLDGIVLFPAWTAFHQAAEHWSDFDDLFDLVIAVFMSAWLVGWSVAPLLLTAVLAVLLGGREIVRVKNNTLELFTGLPFLGLVARYDTAAVRNLEWQEAAQKSGRSWRGGHLVFDYGANQVKFGSDLSISEASEIRLSIEAASGTTLRKGSATEQELSGAWESADLSIAAGAASAGNQSPRSRPLIRWSSPSSLLLIAANLVPVAGAALLGWNLGEVMVLYWCESAIVGFFNLARIIAISRWSALFIGPFFLAHYSAFMAAHFLFIYALFIDGPGGSGPFSGGELSAVGQMFVTLSPALVALFISHGYSFVVNFLGHYEFEARPVKDQMADPYKRIVFMHLVLIFGGGLTLALGNPTPVLLLVIVLKICLDVRAHIKEHAFAAWTRQ